MLELVQRVRRAAARNAASVPRRLTNGVQAIQVLRRRFLDCFAPLLKTDELSHQPEDRDPARVRAVQRVTIWDVETSVSVMTSLRLKRARRSATSRSIASTLLPRASGDEEER